MASEFRFNNRDEWVLVRVKRDWVPEWLFKALRHIVFFFPINLLLTRKVDD